MNAAVVEATRAAGYEAAATLDPAEWLTGPLRSPRVGVYFTDTLRRFALKTAPAARRTGLAVLRHPVRSYRARRR